MVIRTFKDSLSSSIALRLCLPHKGNYMSYKFSKNLRKNFKIIFTARVVVGSVLFKLAVLLCARLYIPESYNIVDSACFCLPIQG